MSFNTSSLERRFPSVFCTDTPRLSNALFAFLEPFAASDIRLGSFINPASKFSKLSPLPSAANLKPANVSTAMPVLALASTNWLDRSAMFCWNAKTAAPATAKPAAAPFMDLVSAFPVLLACLDTFSSSFRCFSAAFAASRSAFL